MVLISCVLETETRAGNQSNTKRRRKERVELTVSESFFVDLRS